MKPQSQGKPLIRNSVGFVEMSGHCGRGQEGSGPLNSLRSWLDYAYVCILRFCHFVLELLRLMSLAESLNAHVQSCVCSLTHQDSTWRSQHVHVLVRVYEGCIHWFDVVVLGLVSFVPSQETDWEECPWNDLFLVEWNTTLTHNQSICLVGSDTPSL